MSILSFVSVLESLKNIDELFNNVIFNSVASKCIAAILLLSSLYRFFLKKKSLANKNERKFYRYNLWINNVFVKETNASRIFQNIILSLDNKQREKVLKSFKLNDNSVLLDKKSFNKLESIMKKNYIPLCKNNSDFFVIKYFDYSNTEKYIKNLEKVTGLKIKVKLV